MSLSTTVQYTLNWTMPFILLRHYKRFINGAFFNDGLSLSVAQYVLYNLRDVSLQYVHPAIVVNSTEGGNGSEIQGIIEGVVGAQSARVPLMEDHIEPLHVSPTFKSEAIYITTCVQGEQDSGPSVATVGGLGLTIWLITFCTICILSISTYCFQKCRGKRVTLVDCLWFYVSSMLHNVSQTDSDLSTRLMLSGWLFGSMVIMTLYSGNINSQLLVGRSKFVDNIDDVLDDSDLKPAIKIGSPFEKSLEAQWPGRPKQFDELLARHDRNPNEIHQGKELVNRWPKSVMSDFLAGKLAAFEDDRFMNWVFDKISDELRKTGKRLYYGKAKYIPVFYTMVFNKNLPRDILENADYLVARYAETAQWVVIDRYRNFRQRPFLAKKMYTRKVKPLQLTYLKRATTIWLYGVLSSILCHIVKWFWICFINRDQNKTYY